MTALYQKRNDRRSCHLRMNDLESQWFLEGVEIPIAMQQ
jgi:hypothetical protein